jgi:hypothetical protein
VTPRRQLLADQAARDIAARARILRRERGAAFAGTWVDTLLSWLDALAEGGAVLGAAHPEDPSLRVFGYRRQASILAEFAPGELRVIRVYFRGQDWSRF